MLVNASPNNALLGACLFVTVAVASSCSAKLEGTLSIDGKAVVLDSCQSGERYDFAGVDLMTDQGTKIRLVALPDGNAQVFLFDKGSRQGTGLGPCGPFTLNRQNSTINDITNVEGTATLSCKLGARSLTGEVRFGNCH